VALPAPERTARTLLLALDAVPFRVVREAFARGAFADWPAPSALVAPFPSLTHAGFAALFEPFGVDPSRGYEVRYFDATANRMVGGNPLTYRNEVPPWGELFDATHRSVVAKVSNYVSAPRAAAAELDAIFAEVLASTREVVIAYVGATDGFMHLYDDEAMVEFLLDLDDRVRDLRRRHLEACGRPLQLALFSDHGCGREPVHYTGSLKPLLRAAGLHVVDRLAGPDDVVAPTFGIVNYSALFLQSPQRAALAAGALTAHEAVDVASYLDGPGRIEVVASAGRARIRWRDTARGRRYAYEDVDGDVLRLSGAAQRLAAAGLLDDDRFAHEDDWLRESAFEAYPDPLRRLADALAGDRIASRATVLLSLGPGWSWGWRSAFAGGLVRGGRLKGTHGGLDREATLGFLATSDPGPGTPAVVRADRALAPFAEAVRAERQASTGS
jgi:hypothetical protein